MPAPPSIPLSSLRVHWRLADCPIGALIQTTDPTGSPLVGLRTEWSALPEPLLGTVVLEGPDAGWFFSDQALDPRPAVNLTEVAEIRVKKITPGPLQNPIGPGERGKVFYMNDKDGNDCVGIAVATQNAPVPRYFLHLSVGRLGQLVHLGHHIYIGEIEIVAHST